MGLLDYFRTKDCVICKNKVWTNKYLLYSDTWICIDCLNKLGGIFKLDEIRKLGLKEIKRIANEKDIEITAKASSNNNYNNSYSENDYYFDDYDFNDSIKIHEKFKYILDKHYKNIEKIDMLYTVANNLSLPNSPEMQKVIELCLDDIRLAPDFLEYCKEIANYYKTDLQKQIPTYPSFYRLAIIYEKQKEYQKAIDICNYAIKLGYIRDGTKGQMPGRIARLIRKARQQNIQIDEEKVIDITNL